MGRSRSPSVTGKRECGLLAKVARMVLGSSLRSTSSTSVRGVMTAPTGRSPSRITPAIISFSGFKHAGALCLPYDVMNLIFGYLRFGLGTSAEQCQDKLPGHIQQDNERHRNSRHEIHSRGDLDCD